MREERHHIQRDRSRSRSADHQPCVHVSALGAHGRGELAPVAGKAAKTRLSQQRAILAFQTNGERSRGRSWRRRARRNQGVARENREPVALTGPQRDAVEARVSQPNEARTRARLDRKDGVLRVVAVQRLARLDRNAALGAATLNKLPIRERVPAAPILIRILERAVLNKFSV